jgi:hypothetical protein
MQVVKSGQVRGVMGAGGMSRVVRRAYTVLYCIAPTLARPGRIYPWLGTPEEALYRAESNEDEYNIHIHI